MNQPVLKPSSPRVIDRLRNYLGAAPNSIKNHLNGEELSRIIVTSVSAGGGLFALLQIVLVNVNTIFPASSDAALAALLLTGILEAIRRLGHGAEPPVKASSHLRRR